MGDADWFNRNSGATFGLQPRWWQNVYSIFEGWYAANPQAIIPTSMNQGGDAANFRDPSVVYDAVNKQYYLTVVSGQQALIYKSSNLLDWTYASKIERENDVGNGAGNAHHWNR